MSTPAMDITELKPFEDKVVKIVTTDGELLTAKIDFVDFEYKDIVVTVIATNQPHHYRHKDACYTVSAADIVSIAEAST
jgi:hypothetical protein